MKKSYHSMVVPTAEAASTRRVMLRSVPAGAVVELMGILSSWGVFQQR